MYEKKIILIDGEIPKSEIVLFEISESNKRYNVKYKGNKVYSYNMNRIKELLEDDVIEGKDLLDYQIYKNNKLLFNISKIFRFKSNDGKEFFRILFNNGTKKDYSGDDLFLIKSCLNDNDKSKCIFNYLKELSSLSDIKNEQTGKKLLEQIFEKISFVGEDVALSKYINPNLLNSNSDKGKEYIPIFPFGCNNSQYEAVKIAMENQISIIQGPPGTGKTQTILNIIANILKDNKNVIVVSNNNSATENVYQKLASPEYNLGFIVAKLGSSENRNIFIEGQDGKYPDFSKWKNNDNSKENLHCIKTQSLELKKVFDKQERLALLKQELSCLNTEEGYFNRLVENLGVDISFFKFSKSISAKKIISLLNEMKLIYERHKTISFWFKLRAFFKYGIKEQDIYKKKNFEIITIFQYYFFKIKKQELIDEISEIENYLNSADANLLKELCENSMKILKDILSKKYPNEGYRQIFKSEDLRYNTAEFLNEYPVILSTTFSSRNSLNFDTKYDYLIMDEASQVDIVTGALALSCAKNVVIVGDTKQLPNIISSKAEKDADAIFSKYNINEGYKYQNSFLQSILDVIPNIKSTLLREHYRCHPKIINFCNRKFYNNELIIMTEDNDEEDVLSVIKTVQGNHARNRYSQRQIDIIKDEVLNNSKFDLDIEKTGIISPYRNQSNEIKFQLGNIISDTVHKFQGQEKENIIISTVDDNISEFADNPYLINVAVSRAKRKLILIVSGNEQIKDSNIMDLVGYIKYNNFDIIDSKVNSIFDYLYSQYEKERESYLKKHKQVSKYDSENLMYILLKDILENNYNNLDFKFSYPLYLLIRDRDMLDQKEKMYVENLNTHIDFLIFNKIDNSPVLAIEVDGYRYHKVGTTQSYRDDLKNTILQKYGIPIIRLSTNGSNEKQKIIDAIDEYYCNTNKLK